jgi:glycosyltransferase involved in cell wall biosynthesis
VVVVDLSVPGWRPKNAILNLAVPRADAILPYSVAQAQAIRDTWPDAKLVYPVQAQVDPAFYTETPDQPDGPVLAVGDDVSRDYPTLLAAAASVPHRIVIRSKRLQPDGLLPNVEVLSKPLPLPSYRDLLGTASVMVLPLAPMVNGAGSSALVQAMACGKASVVSASPGILDYVEDGVTGFIVPCSDPEALGAAINRLLTDHDLRRRMGAAARQRALRLNSYEAWADTIETVVNLLDRGPG